MDEDKLWKARELLRLINVYGVTCCAHPSSSGVDPAERMKAYKAVKAFMKRMGLKWKREE